MKTKEELNALKEAFETLNAKLAQIAGGLDIHTITNIDRGGIQLRNEDRR